MDGDQHDAELPLLLMGYPHSRRKTISLVAGVRMTSMTALIVLNGLINGDWLEAYVGKMLGPDLGGSDVVTMDNLSSYKRARVRRAIEAAGTRLTSHSPYNSDFNPIEKAFSRLNTMPHTT